MNDEKNLDLTNKIKQQNQKLGKDSKKLGQDMESLYRDFNGLIRFFYQEFSTDSFSVPKIRGKVRAEVRDKKVVRVERREQENVLKVEKNNTDNLKLKSISKIKKKKKRNIVWNAWVIDTSSESSSDSDLDSG